MWGQEGLGRVGGGRVVLAWVSVAWESQGHLFGQGSGIQVRARGWSGRLGQSGSVDPFRCHSSQIGLCWGKGGGFLAQAYPSMGFALWLGVTGTLTWSVMSTT